MADRLLYLPSLGLLACRFWGLCGRGEPKFAMLFRVLGLVSGFAAAHGSKSGPAGELGLATHDVRSAREL